MFLLLQSCHMFINKNVEHNVRSIILCVLSCQTNQIQSFPSNESLFYFLYFHVPGLLHSVKKDQVLKFKGYHAEQGLKMAREKANEVFLITCSHWTTGRCRHMTQLCEREVQK